MKRVVGDWMSGVGGIVTIFASSNLEMFHALIKIYRLCIAGIGGFLGFDDC